jgi:hypothetical protein
MDDPNMSSLGNGAARESSTLEHIACTEWLLKFSATESSLGIHARTDWLLPSGGVDLGLEKHDSAESKSPLRVDCTEASLMELGACGISFPRNHSCNRTCTQ